MSEKIKVNINNKPVNRIERDKQKKRESRKKRLNGISMDSLIDYVEVLEERIVSLENKVNVEEGTEGTNLHTENEKLWKAIRELSEKADYLDQKIKRK